MTAIADTSLINSSNSWLARVARYLFAAEASECPPVDDSYSPLGKHAAVMYGRAILAAECRADLAVALDECAWSPEYILFHEYVARLMMHEGPSVSDEMCWRETLSRLVDGRCELRTREFASLNHAAECAVMQFWRVLPELPMPPVEASSLCELLHDLRTPPEYSEAVMGALRAELCQLALIAGQLHEQDDNAEPVPSWQALSLLDFACDGLRQHLRLLAGVPGIEGLEQVVPVEDRISWTHLVGHWSDLKCKVDQVTVDADRSGQVVYAPFGGVVHNDEVSSG